MASDSDTRLPSGQPEQNDNAQAGQRVINTQGGDYAEGGIDNRQGIFVKGNLFITEEQAYNVAGLPNPFIGLRTFTAAERDIFAGRENIINALLERLCSSTGDRLLFIVGASGSGKSSLVRAGLLPVLTDQLTSFGYAVSTHIIDHPGRTPAHTLERILQQLSSEPATKSQRTLLLFIDQFEELFIQIDPTHSQIVLSELLELVRSEYMVRVIATMRSDFLPQLVAEPQFEIFEQSKVVLRGMSSEQLSDAIQRPIQIRHPQKRMDPALVQRLSHDASLDESLLPLLQVTLEDIWRSGTLRLNVYHGLANAIQRRADTVYEYRDFDGVQQIKRSINERKAILDLLLRLVRVSLNENQPVIRWRCNIDELSDNNSEYKNYINELARARILRIDYETWVENGNTQKLATVDIVHEALLREWPVLRSAIEDAMELLRRRVRVDLALKEWLNNNHDDAYLLYGIRLAEAEDLLLKNDLIVKDSVKEYIDKSLQHRNASLKRAQTLQAEAERAALRARAGELAALSQAAREWHPQRSLLLAIEAIRIADSTGSYFATPEQALRDTLEVVSGQVLRGHSDAITCLELSNDGRLLVTASRDRTVRLWAIEESEVDSSSNVLYSHEDEILSLALSGNNTKLATAGKDQTIRVWDFGLGSSSKKPVILKGHTATIWALALSADGKRLVSGSGDGTIILWNLEDNTASRVLKDHRGAVLTLSLSIDGNLLVSGGSDQIVRLWRLNEDDPCANVQLLHGHSGVVLASKISFDSRMVITSSSDHTARIWKLHSLEFSGETTILNGHESTVWALALSVDGKTLVTGSGDGTSRVWNLRLSDPKSDNFVLRGHRDGIETVSLSRDGSILLTTSWDNTARVWNIGAKDPHAGVQVLRGHERTILASTVSANNQFIVTGSSDGTVRVWGSSQTRANSMFSIVAHSSSAISCLALSRTEDKLLAGDIEGFIHEWKLQKDKLYSQNIIRGHINEASMICLSSDASVIATASKNHISRIWGFDSFSESYVPLIALEHESEISALSMSGDGKLVIIGDALGYITVYSIKDEGLIGEKIKFRGHEGKIWSISVGEDKKTIATGGSDHVAKVWIVDQVRSEVIQVASLNGHQSGVLSVLFSNNGSTVITGSSDHTIRVWRLSTEGVFENTVILRGHERAVLIMALDANGQFLASSSRDRTVRVWDLHSDQPNLSCIILRGSNHSISSLVMSNTRKALFAGCADGTVQLWELDRFALCESACKIAGRNLSLSEWQQFFGNEPYRRTCPNLPDGEGVNEDQGGIL